MIHYGNKKVKNDNSASQEGATAPSCPSADAHDGGSMHTERITQSVWNRIAVNGRYTSRTGRYPVSVHRNIIPNS